MMYRTLVILFTTTIVLAVIITGQSRAQASVNTLSNPCSSDPNNLIKNGMMAPGGSSQWGPTANKWTAFVISGDPEFNWVDNEGWDPDGAQYIVGTAPFDAGIYQTVYNLQPGMYYHFWVGYALAAYDNGDTVNRRYDQIGRRIGVDIRGGTDPNSPNVTWGPEVTDGKPALNIPAMGGIFAAQSDHATLFVRGINHSSQYSNKLWFDSICMESRPDMPTATPMATVTATPSPTRASSPTNSPRAMAQSAPVVPVVTRVPTSTPTPTATATLPPTNTPTVTLTPTQTAIPTDTPKPRHAIPQAGASTNSAAGSGSDSMFAAESSSNNASGMVVLLGSIGLIGASGVGILGLAAFILFRVLRRPSSREIRYN